jgi:hypothetical protein
LNALVRWIVCAVGFREALATACVLLAALLPFVLLEPLVFVPPLPVFPVAAPDEAVLLFVVGFFVCSVAEIEFCLSPATPLGIHTTIIPIREATATAPRSLSQVLVTVLSLFQPT